MSYEVTGARNEEFLRVYQLQSRQRSTLKILDRATWGHRLKAVIDVRQFFINYRATWGHRLKQL